MAETMGAQLDLLGAGLLGQTMLFDSATKAGIDKRVTSDGLRKSWNQHQGGRTDRPESQIEAYVNDDDFRRLYEDAYLKWNAANSFYVLDPTCHSTRIGHDCREALMLFAIELARKHDLEDGTPPEKTVHRIREVLAKHQERLGKRVVALCEALLAYWEQLATSATAKNTAWPVASVLRQRKTLAGSCSTRCA